MIPTRRPMCAACLGLNISNYLLAGVRMGRDPGVIAILHWELSDIWWLNQANSNLWFMVLSCILGWAKEFVCSLSFVEGSSQVPVGGFPLGNGKFCIHQKCAAILIFLEDKLTWTISLKLLPEVIQFDDNLNQKV